MIWHNFGNKENKFILIHKESKIIDVKIQYILYISIITNENHISENI